MKNIFHSQITKMMLPYFILAVTVIIAWRLINEVESLFGFITWMWSKITPFVYGFLLAYCLAIPCGGIEKLINRRAKNKFIKKRKKALSILAIYILFFLTIYLVFKIIVPPIVESYRFFSENLPNLNESLQGYIAQINEMEIFPEINIGMEEILAKLSEFNFEDISAHARQYGEAVGSGIFTAFLAFVSSIYILFEKDKFKAFLCRLLNAVTSAPAYNTTLKYARLLNNNFKQYIYTQTIDGLILGTIVTIELYFMGSTYFLLLGVILGVLNYIPYFGSIVGTIIAILVVTLTQGLTMGLIATVVLFITQQFDGNVLQPKLMGGSFSLSPLLVIISIVIGRAFAGTFGMIAAIPIVAVLKDVLENIVVHYEQKKLTKTDERYG